MVSEQRLPIPAQSDPRGFAVEALKFFLPCEGGELRGATVIRRHEGVLAMQDRRVRPQAEIRAHDNTNTQIDLYSAR